MRYRWAWLPAGAVAIWLLWMTLRPSSMVVSDLAPLIQSAVTSLVPVHVLVGLLGNIVVFVPLGAALVVALGGRSTWERLLLAVVAGSALSLSIELLQMVVPSRVSAAGDWLLNTAGTAMGALAGFCIQKTLWRKRA